jgi:hypothetical protein
MPRQRVLIYKPYKSITNSRNLSPVHATPVTSWSEYTRELAFQRRPASVASCISLARLEMRLIDRTPLTRPIPTDCGTSFA